MKLMLIEDDLIQATSLRFQLEQLSYQDIIIANSGEQAVDLLSQNEFDLVFCDIRMPGMDGIKLLSTYIDKNKVKGVVITSSVDDSIMGVTRGICNLIGYEFVDVLCKPFTLESLEQVIERFQGRVRQTAEAHPASELQAHDIHNAFTQDQLFVLYQPQFDFKTGQLFGVEALVRMEHPDYGLIPPMDFLPLIEQLGLEKELFCLVLNKATKAMVATNFVVNLSVNISQSLLELDLCDLVLGICKETNFPPSKLTIELTEEQAYESTPLALSNLARLRLYDIDIAIDDFGTGFAALDKLVDLPFSELKIDRRFIQNITHSYKLQQITSLALKLAQSLGMNCVAEGVEDVETWEYLKEIGVDICQGYYTGKPMPMKEIGKYVDLYRLENNIDSESFGHITTLVFDRYSESTQALTRLMSKQLPGAQLIAAKDFNDVLRQLRDLPVTSIVCNSEIFTRLKDEIDEKTLAELNVLVLVDDKAAQTLSDLNEASFLVRSSDLSSMTEKVCEKIILKSNGIDSLHARFSMLSQREFDVTKLLIAGFSNKYISYELGINQTTVSTYKRRVLEKLDVKSTVDLVRIFGEYSEQ